MSVAAGLLLGLVLGAGESAWLEDAGQALKVGRETGKPIFAIFH